jgi:cytochrome P450
MPTTAADVPEHLLSDFDLYDLSICDPEDTMQERVRELAQIAPVVYCTPHGGHWFVTRYDVVNEILHSPEVFSNYPSGLLDAPPSMMLPLNSDPPEHTAYRNVLQPLFSPTRTKALQGEIRRHVTELIDGFIEKGECDFVADFAHQLPTRVFLWLMDLPREDAPLFSDLAQKAFFGKPGGTEEESNAVRVDVAQQLGAYFARVIDERRGRSLGPDSDVASIVINTPLQLDGQERPLADEELQSMLLLTLVAGLHTTQPQLAWALMYLARYRDERQRLIDDPSLLPNAVEELLRLEASAFPVRRVKHEIEIGGVTMREEDRLLLALCSANRDPSRFEDPDTMSIDRKHVAHLSFGGGRHRCIGSHIAREQLRITLEECHRRLPDYELTQPAVCHPSQARSVLSMPIRFTPGPRSGVRERAHDTTPEGARA